MKTFRLLSKTVNGSWWERVSGPSQQSARTDGWEVQLLWFNNQKSWESNYWWLWHLKKNETTDTQTLLTFTSLLKKLMCASSTNQILHLKECLNQNVVVNPFDGTNRTLPKKNPTVSTVEVVKIDLCLYQSADLKVLNKWTIKKTHWKITICRLPAISLWWNT